MENLNYTMDPEQRPVAEKHLLNTTVKNLTWRGVTVTVKDRETKQPKTIVDNVEGIVEAGSSITLVHWISMRN
ncbi:hypothetical protein AUP68_18125 [Ilyonectria robusta]